MHWGLLLLRVGIGIVFIAHGWPKLTGGVEVWQRLGGAMGSFGISFAPAFWGFMAAFAECIGGLAIALGILVRPFAGLLLITMIVAAGMHIGKGDAFSGWSHALSMGIVFLSLVISGAGDYRLGRLLGCGCGCGCGCGGAKPAAPAPPAK